jgi:hypothetical protein
VRSREVFKKWRGMGGEEEAAKLKEQEEAMREK